MRIASVLGDSFDLTYRPTPGDVSYFRRFSQYRHLDDQGLVTRIDGYQGDFRRVVESVGPDGRVDETLTWRNVFRLEAGPDAKFGPPERLVWADDFSYRFCIDDSYANFDNATFDSIPRDLPGWFFVLLVRDTQGPIDNVRSRAFSIQELRHIGDAYVLRRSKEEAASAPNLTFLPLVDVPKFEVADMTSRFEALTVCGGEACAIVRFESAPCRFETVFAENLMLGGSTFRGTLTLRLSDGSHQHAECLEYVMFEGGGKTSPHYEMWRIAEKDYITK